MRLRKGQRAGEMPVTAGDKGVRGPWESGHHGGNRNPLSPKRSGGSNAPTRGHADVDKDMDSAEEPSDSGPTTSPLGDPE